MDSASRARGGVCPVDGPVIALVVGGRWKCGKCGRFVPKVKEAASLPTPLPVPVGGGSVDEVLRRIELRETIREAREGLERTHPGQWTSILDRRVALMSLDYLNAQAMTLPLADLERAVKQVLERATEAAQIPRLHEDVDSLRAYRDALSSGNEQLV